MKTTFEIRPKLLAADKKVLLDKLHIRPNIRNASITMEDAGVSFEYTVHNDLQVVRRELHELGYQVINYTHYFDTSTDFG